MLALQQKPAGEESQCQVNVLPCTIQRNGPSKVTKRLWAPKKEHDGRKTVYFRGRKLQGRTVALPEGYSGLVVSKTDQKIAPESIELPSTRPTLLEDDGIDDEEDEPSEPIKILKEEARFNELVVWGHDQVPDTDDKLVKGIEEWIHLAEAVHAQPKTELPSSTISAGPD